MNPSPTRMPAAASLVDLLAARVAATPDRPALAVVADGSVTTRTWAEVAAAALTLAANFTAAGGDVEAVREGRISVTALRAALAHVEAPPSREGS